MNDLRHSLYTDGKERGGIRFSPEHLPVDLHVVDFCWLKTHDGWALVSKSWARNRNTRWVWTGGYQRSYGSRERERVLRSHLMGLLKVAHSSPTVIARIRGSCSRMAFLHLS